MDDTSLVDNIYECAFMLELWPGVLDQLAVIGGAEGGVLFTGNGSVVNWTSSAALYEAMGQFVGRGLLATSQRQPRLLGARHSGFVGEHDIYREDELGHDPLYRDFLWPLGLGWAAGTAIGMPTGDALIVSLERARSSGPVDMETIHKLDLLRPHIARSAFLSARQNLARARAASDTLAMIGLPAIVMDAAGKVLAANHLAEQLTAHVRWGAADRFSLADRAADALLRQAIATLDVKTAAVRSFVIRDAAAAAALVAHVLPLRGSGRDLFIRCSAVLVMTSVAMPNAPPIELVQSLFDLTAAEARVARGLVVGDTVDEIAAGGGVSKETVRSHLRGVLGKTGCRRQAEVVALLSGVSLPITHAAQDESATD